MLLLMVKKLKYQTFCEGYNDVINNKKASDEGLDELAKVQNILTDFSEECESIQNIVNKSVEIGCKSANTKLHTIREDAAKQKFTEMKGRGASNWTDEDKEFLLNELTIRGREADFKGDYTIFEKMEELPESYDRNTSIVLLCQLNEKIKKIKGNLFVIKKVRDFNQSVTRFQDKIESLRKKRRNK